MENELILLFHKHLPKIKEFERLNTEQNLRKRHYYSSINTRDLVVYAISIGSAAIELKSTKNFMSQDDAIRNLVVVSKGTHFAPQTFVIVPTFTEKLYKMASADGTITAKKYQDVRLDLLQNITCLCDLGKNLSNVIVDYVFLNDDILDS